ncbi:T9SS type A sorting domain-containing protein [Lacibacter sp.]|uniref:T9SS type A sorting domain-containing protein n=1 Tax=Lacibacter sp. TaxID=1915409 RepID=UPI002B4B5109|nr:T9SS type A sorting domain-containing protein [Lacibacter sp.]HLP38142.1 T9SS type A sorting domain-containing protein [Lacibacter sp.]
MQHFNLSAYLRNKVSPQFSKKSIALLSLVFLISLFQYEVKAQTSGYTWKNAPIGGGGFVTGIVTHKTSGDRYCRTDVGGAYRWDAANNKWIQLLDWLNESENGFIGVDALALDPQNANNVYMLCGTSYINNGRTAILKSTDKGNTFTYTDVTSKFKTHGNGNGRGNGERLAVDPKNSNILFCGTRSNGLWKSTDAGVTWNLAWNGVTTTPNENGICFVLFDPSGSVVNGASQTIYIGVSRTGGGNIYKSTNGGASFTDITPTTSFMPHRAALQGTTMYVTYADGAGPALNGDGKLYKLNTSTGAWTNVTPVHSKDYSYGGVSIDPTNINRVIVSTCGMYWNNQFGTGWGDFIFITTDGGSTWTLKNGSNATYDANGMEWSRGGAINWMDCIEFDQDNLLKVRVIGGGGVYTCSDITATNTSWKYDVIGIEETAFLDGTSIPGGPFISSFGDVSGFRHEPLTSAPSTRLSPAGGYNNHSIAYAAGNTNKVVRIGNGDNIVYYSNDKGSTWTGASSNMGASGRVAVSADGGTILHCPGGSSTTYYTTNNGGNWSASSGVSLGDAAPVADQVNANYFYIFHPSTGQMFRSTNKGVSFSVAGTPGSSTANHPWEAVLIRTLPGFEGHVWVPLGRNGLKYSTNAGVAYTTVSNVTYCKSIGIGKAMSGSNYPTIFIWGTVSGVTGLFRSTDQGVTWLRLNDDAHQFAGAPLLIGDMNVAGRVFMSAGGGRGVIYWEPATGSCTPTTITPYLQINGGTWQQTANTSLTVGDTLMFGPQPAEGGTWSWGGPNNFSAATREVFLPNIQANQAGNYAATYTNNEGCQSTQTFNITVTAPCTPTAITPYLQINGGAWQQTANASLTAGGSVMFGPQPTQGGSWNWSGPNNFSATTREVTISNIQANQAGNYVATYTNDGGCQSTQTFNVTVTTAATGSILREYWTGINGSTISSLTTNVIYPNNPTGSVQLTSLEGPTNWANNYGTRIRGYVHPATSGSYTFWVAGNDNTELYLSTSDNPANSSRIAYVNGSTNSRQWNKYASQQSVTINLTGGQKYYIEVLHKEGTGADNIAVAWQGPGISQQVIAGSYLSPFVPAGGSSSSAVVSLNEDEINLYPNPSNKGRFTVILPETLENATVKIFDDQGRMVYEKSAQSNKKIEIDSQLQPGLYIVRITYKAYSLTKRLIVN